jgi:hypothetical protein
VRREGGNGERESGSTAQCLGQADVPAVRVRRSLTDARPRYRLQNALATGRGVLLVALVIVVALGSGSAFRRAITSLIDNTLAHKNLGGTSARSPPTHGPSVVVVEKNEGVSQVAIDEVGTAAEGVMDHGPERVLRIHDARDVPHRDPGVVDPFKRVVE